MKTLKISLVLLATLSFLGCPDKAEQKRKEIVEEVGGAPKKTIDNVKVKTDASLKKMEKRLNDAAKKADDGGW